jgi:hypothetical protein
MRTCEGCGAELSPDAVQWYRWNLCSRCKSRSVVTGWLPADATSDELHQFQEAAITLRGSRIPALEVELRVISFLSGLGEHPEIDLRINGEDIRTLLADVLQILNENDRASTRT